MREIRFRGKTKYGVWVYGGFVKLNDAAYIAKVERQTFEPYSEIATMEEVDPKSVGQFTGLHDRNGREIYEGDIVRFFEIGKELISPVEQVIECGTGHYIRLQGRGYFSLNPTVIDRNYVEVIGNIYEHPHLLEREGDGA